MVIRPKRLNEMIAGIGISKKNLAEQIGLRPDQMSRVISGYRELNSGQKDAIAKILKKDRTWLFGKER